MGPAADVDRAVTAARRTFPSNTRTKKAERLELLRVILAEYDERYYAIAATVTEEIGAPLSFPMDAQAWAGQAQIKAAIDALEAFEFEH